VTAGLQHRNVSTSRGPFPPTQCLSSASALHRGSPHQCHQRVSALTPAPLLLHPYLRATPSAPLLQPRHSQKHPQHARANMKLLLLLPACCLILLHSSHQAPHHHQRAFIVQLVLQTTINRSVCSATTTFPQSTPPRPMLPMLLLPCCAACLDSGPELFHMIPTMLLLG